jgi:hypothetical protein
VRGRVERQSELRRERGQPREHVAELVQLFVGRSLAHRARELTDLFGEPRDGRRPAPRPVPRAVRARHQLLEGVDLHGVGLPPGGVTARRLAATLTGHHEFHMPHCDGLHAGLRGGSLTGQI